MRLHAGLFAARIPGGVEVCPHPRPLSHKVGEGISGQRPCAASPFAGEVGEGAG